MGCSTVQKAGAAWFFVHVLVFLGIVIGLYFSVPESEHSALQILYEEPEEVSSEVAQTLLFAGLEGVYRMRGKVKAGLAVWQTEENNTRIRMEAFEMAKDDTKNRVLYLCNLSSALLWENESLSRRLVTQHCTAVANSGEKGLLANWGTYSWTIRGLPKMPLLSAAIFEVDRAMSSSEGQADTVPPTPRPPTKSMQPTVFSAVIVGTRKPATTTTGRVPSPTNSIRKTSAPTRRPSTNQPTLIGRVTFAPTFATRATSAPTLIGRVTSAPTTFRLVTPPTTRGLVTGSAPTTRGLVTASPPTTFRLVTPPTSLSSGPTFATLNTLGTASMVRKQTPGPTTARPTASPTTPNGNASVVAVGEFGESLPENVTVGELDGRNLRDSLGLRIMGVTAFLAYAIFLQLITLVSMLMSKQRRTHQAIAIIILSLNLLATMLVMMQPYVASTDEADRASCQAMGFFQQLFSFSAIVWYVMGAFSTFFALFSTRRFEEYSYPKARLRYHLIAWPIVVVNLAILWGLEAVEDVALSFGPLSPWVFCWIPAPTINYAFFVPAGVAVLINLVCTVWIIVLLVRTKRNLLAKSSKSSGTDTLRTAVALFVSNNVGTIAYGVLGIFLVLTRNTADSNTLVVFAALLFIQAVALWLVFFARRTTMLLWVACCRGSLKEVNTGSTELESMASITSASSSPFTREASDSTDERMVEM